MKSSVKDWQDQGFPTTLTTEGTKYQGQRKTGEDKQRAFTTAELTRLFDGAELSAFRADPAQVHKWWLPMIGLYTGARVNEICQLNPQCDILEDEESGIQYIWFTSTTEADVKVRKSIKNATSHRKVPIHTSLIRHGLLDYVKHQREAGATRLFQEWNPTNDRASTQAEKYFRELLQAICLRDDTPGARIVGMYAFRFTLLTRAINSNPRIDAGPITGHAGYSSKSQRGYEGELSLVNKQKLLEAIDFGYEPKLAGTQ